MKRRFSLRKFGTQEVGWFEIDKPVEQLPKQWREMVELAGTDTTITYQMPDGKRFYGVSVVEVPVPS